ncbi:MAG: phosphate ABC transporter substrate-binding protein PstS [Janthinobacterium lividum]
MISSRRARNTTFAALAALASLSLVACGSDPAGTPAPAASGSGSGSADASGVTCPSGKLNAEGSTAQGNAITEVIADYEAACNNASTIEYNPTGSGAGIMSFYNNLVDFAGSDSALKTVAVAGVVEADKAKARCGGNPAWNIPMVVGPIAFAYNVDGVTKLTLNAEVLSKIFNGTIKTWNDPAIAKLNSGVTLPSAPITVFFRSDESGTTENTTKFLAAAGNGAWTKPPAKAWAGTGEGKNKSSGVAEAVSSTKNSISYMEWSYASDNKLGIAQLDSGNGPVELSGDSVGKAVSEATVAGTGNDLALKLNYQPKTAGAYPALLTTYEIVCSTGLAADKTALEKDFLTFFSSAEEQQALQKLNYAPLPSDLLTKVKTAVAAIS